VSATPQGLPLTGTCDVSTLGRRSGETRRTEIWYVVVDGRIVLTGTPGPRSWLANLRAHRDAVLHLRDPARDVEVVAREVTDPAERRRVAEEARRLQPWYAEQPSTIDDWVAASPMVVLEPAPPPGRPAPAGARAPRGPARRWLRTRPADVIDVFVYVVVLNLAIEYVPAVISEGFTLSLLTAVLLKVALEVVIRLKTEVVDRLRAATTRRGKVTAALALWVVAAGSKLVVLGMVDLVFGDAVSLGGFVPVTLLVVALLVSRAAVRRLLDEAPAAV
jgi:deazaflavin-dependent oxidoreductase (nitroreductase family)